MSKHIIMLKAIHAWWTKKPALCKMFIFRLTLFSNPSLIYLIVK